MSLLNNVWCVQHSDGWCATENGKAPTEDAWVDLTACNHSVTMRIGSAKRRPTCEECIDMLTAAPTPMADV